MHRALAAVSIALALACGGPEASTTPLLAPSEASSQLVERLSLPDATPTICDPRHPHHAPVTDPQRLVRELWQATQSGAVTVDVAMGCMEPPQLETDVRAAWYRQVTEHVVRRSTRRAELEGDEARFVDALVARLRLVPLHAMIDEATRLRWIARLQRRHSAERPVVVAMLEVLTLNAGRYRRQPVTRETIQAIDDEALLERMARVLPDETLRDVARDRWIRSAVARRDPTTLGGDPEEVVRRVVKTGWNAIEERQLQIESLTVHGERLASLSIAIGQDTARNEVFLRLHATGSAQEAWDAGSLRGVVEARVAGLPQPITLCDDPRRFALDPCLHPAAVRLGTRLARVSADGRIDLAERVPMAKFAELVVDGWRITLRPKIADAIGPSIDVPMELLPVEPLRMVGEHAGADGPALGVVVRDVGEHVLVRVATGDAQRDRSAFVRRDDAGFEVVSVGATGHAGSTGSPGSNGADGTSGANASCPGSPGGNGTAGGNGGPGGRGGDGGPGGDGGRVVVELLCEADEQCARLDAFARAHVSSRGGPGGPGGPGGQGGRGGRGGAGGMGTSCQDGDTTKSVPGGSAGPDGSDGSDGPSGAHGPSGADRAIEVRRRG